jgi:GNAT superfamily N-acetyltransferase
MVLIRALNGHDLEKIKTFTDRWIGQDYYSKAEIEEGLGFSGGASFGAFEGEELLAVRLSYAPGSWLEKARGLTPSQWRVSQKKVAYFKSLFVAEACQGKGIGRQLSERSLAVLRERGAEAVICHSWLESPGNSSQRYLQGMGFSEVARHQRFWFPIDYLCTRCAPERCVCTAVEMIKYLEL